MQTDENLNYCFFFRNVTAHMADDVILFVIGDHGMTGTGILFFFYKLITPYCLNLAHVQ